MPHCPPRCPVTLPAVASPSLPRRRLTPSDVVAVAAGGTVGVALRVALALVIGSPPLGFPSATLAVNLIGSACLGWLVGRVATREMASWPVGPFLGSGVLGSFTTYSAFAVETNRLLALRPLLGVTYVVVSLAGGIVAAGAGMAAGRR